MTKKNLLYNRYTKESYKNFINTLNYMLTHNPDFQLYDHNLYKPGVISLLILFLSLKFWNLVLESKL